MIVDTLGPDGFGTYQVDWSTPFPTFTRVSKPPQGLLIPGFVDIHIHGAYGIDFMSASHEDLLTLCKKLEADGYEAFLPTTVTAPLEQIRSALSELPEHPMIGGFHLEGPFISPEYPGAQPQESISEIPLTASEWDFVFNHPRLKVVTLAPEIPNALELIMRLMRRGVIVSMGHTAATYEQARRGFEFGASHMTHFYNAMRPFHHREAGTVGYGLQNPDLRCELIYDRLHVAPEAASLLLSSKLKDHVIAVSDSTLATGLTKGSHVEMWGHQCVVGKNEIRLSESDTLAGSAVSLADIFKNLHEDFGAETAIRLCCINPRLALKMPAEPRVYLLLDKKLEIAQRWVR